MSKMSKVPETRVQEMRNIRLPFQGFGDSMHGGRIEAEFEGFFSDSSNGTHTDLIQRLWDEGVVDSGRIETVYAFRYLEVFKDTYVKDILPSLQFKTLAFSDPCETVIAAAAVSEIGALFAATPKAAIKKVVADRCAAQDAANGRRFSGPIPVTYPRDFEQWPDDVLDWDSEQLQELLIAHLMDNGLTADAFKEWEMDFCDEEAAEQMRGWWSESLREEKIWNAIVAERDKRVGAAMAAADQAQAAEPTV